MTSIDSGCAMFSCEVIVKEWKFPMLHKFKENKVGNDYVVGDIHGMYDLLMQSLKEIGFDKSVDRLFSVGDVIDRGPDSIKCLALYYEPWFYGVRGNHEQMAFDAILGYAPYDMWMLHGGLWYADERSDEIDATFHDLSERLPYAIEIDYGDRKVGILHADVPHSNWSFVDRDEMHFKEIMLWDRRRAKRGYGHAVDGVDMVYVGHTPKKEATTIANVMNLDIGAVHYGKFHIEKIT